jgi:hypothetical protein
LGLFTLDLPLNICVGDCDGNGQATIEDILTMSNTLALPGAEQ